MRNTVVMSGDGSVATVVRKVSRVASGRYAVYLPTGLNDLWEDWNRHNVKPLVILKPIKGDSKMTNPNSKPMFQGADGPGPVTSRPASLPIPPGLAVKPWGMRVMGVMVNDIPIIV